MGSILRFYFSCMTSCLLPQAHFPVKFAHHVPSKDEFGAGKRHQFCGKWSLEVLVSQGKTSSWRILTWLAISDCQLLMDLRTHIACPDGASPEQTSQTIGTGNYAIADDHVHLARKGPR